MIQRFIGKRIKKKVIRNRHMGCLDDKKATPMADSNNNKNNGKKKKKDMDNNSLNQVERLMNDVDMENAPKRRTKVEKKDKGLIERTEDCTVLLTEDNKMLLND